MYLFIFLLTTLYMLHIFKLLYYILQAWSLSSSVILPIDSLFYIIIYFFTKLFHILSCISYTLLVRYSVISIYLQHSSIIGTAHIKYFSTFTFSSIRTFFAINYRIITLCSKRTSSIRCFPGILTYHLEVNIVPSY